MLSTFENNFLSSQSETLRLIPCPENRQFVKGNKDRHIRSRLTIVPHYISRAWAVCLFVTGCLAIPQQDRLTVSRFFNSLKINIKT